MVAAPIALIIGGYLVWKQLSAGGAVASRVVLVDVKTGQEFVRGVNQELKVIPDFNPETGERTLFPVVREDGRYVLDPHYREFFVQSLDSLGGPQAVVVDVDTFEITDR